MADTRIAVAGACCKCAVAVRVNEPYTHREVVGWERVDSSTVRWRKATGRLLCATCRWDGPPPVNQLELNV